MRREAFKQDRARGLEETGKTCGHPEAKQRTGVLTKTPCVFE